MKKLFIIVCLLTTTSLSSFSQSCEIRAQKLLESVGELTAGMLCNTYRVICSTRDEFTNNICTAATLTDRMNFQVGLINLSIKRLNNLDNYDIYKDNYVITVIQIFNGLHTQAQLLLDYATNKSKEKLDAFDAQRNTNWSGISKLLGFKE